MRFLYKYKFIPIFILVCIFAVIRYYAYQDTRHNSGHTQKNRVIAKYSQESFKRIFRSYFIYNNLDHTFFYEHFHSFLPTVDTNSEEYLVLGSLQKSVDSSLLALFNKSYEDTQIVSFIKDRFLLGLTKEKINDLPDNSSYSYQLEFRPIFNPEVTYEKVLENQYFLNLDSKNKLTKNIKDSLGQFDQTAVFAYNSRDIVSDGSYFQSLGGTIRTKIKFKEFNNDLRNFSGEIVFRKYLRVNQHQKFRIKIKSDKIITFMTNLKKEKKKYPAFLTFDFIYPFRRLNQDDTPPSISIYFGKLISNHKEKRDVTSGNYIQYGYYKKNKGEPQYKFKSHIVKLSFNLESQMIIPNQSTINIEILRKGKSAIRTVNINDKTIQNQIKSEIIKSLNKNLLVDTYLKDFLEEYHLW